jgi:voltage-gated potassium channel
MRLTKRSRERLWQAGGLSMAGLLILYFAVPLGHHDSTAQLLLGVAATMVGVLVVGYVIYRYVVEAMHGSRDVMTLANLFLTVELVIIVFSFGYFVLATETTDQMVGIDTRMDALYFTMTTLATVGFGDVHAVGQFARALVTVQIAFNLVFIGALVTVTRTGLSQERSRVRRTQDASDDDTRS